ncbi:MAG TPA: cell division protein ZipA C-terminal FtsZ-binding domain-containing protein [Burkholderiales bacterium]
MSDLQIGLGMLGVLVVASVFGFNWWQERQFRRRAEDSFVSRHDDILLDQHAPAAPAASPAPARQAQADEPEQRIEPRMEPQLATAPSEPAPQSARPVVLDATLPQPEVDYIVEMRAGEFVIVEHLVKLQQQLAGLGRRIVFSGFDYQTKAWGPLTLDAERYTAVRAAIQLVDRSGPVTQEQLQMFGEAMRETAHQMSAIAELPDFAPALQQAALLDEFCADVDVVVGINVIARTGQNFHGTKIRALAEAAGLHLRPDGVFHVADEQGGSLFSLDNQESDPFLIDKIRHLSTPGITFLLDVPRVGNGLKVFDRMVAISRNMADSLDGMLADDNRVMLNDTGLDKIRNQLRAIYAAMEQRGIQPGSPLALRLFS